MFKISMAVALAVGSFAAPARADDALLGKVVLARATGAAIAIYDASPEVTQIVRNNTDDAEANRLLENDALAVLSKELPELKAASTVTVRVTYARNGDVSPAYGSPTFAGIERYANLRCSLAAARADTTSWTTKPPAWATFEVVGKLPPR